MQRLDILKESGVIDSEIYTYTLAVLKYLDKEIPFLDEERVAVFLTHLAMAAARENSGNPIDAMEPFIKEEIINDSTFPRAKDLWQKLEKISPIKFSETEIDYCYVHICSMLKEE